MKLIRLLFVLLLVLTLIVASGCRALDRAEDAVENKVDALEDAAPPQKPLRWDLVTGTLAAPLIRETTGALQEKFPRYL